MLKDEGYLLDMLLEAKKLRFRFAALDRGSLDTDDIRRDAAFWSLTIIGEAAAKVSREFRESHKDIPWREVIGLRNVLVHNYAEIDLDTVWDIIGNHIPRLIPALERIIPAERHDLDST